MHVSYVGTYTSHVSIEGTVQAGCWTLRKYFADTEGELKFCSTNVEVKLFFAYTIYDTKKLKI